MKPIAFLLILLSFMAFSCRDKYSVDTYFKQPTQDSLLTDIVTYIYAYPPQATWDTRFNREFRSYYENSISKFKFAQIYRSDDGTYYFFIIRPARSTEGTMRGTGGRFTLNNENKIVSFKEEFNTPVAALPELRQRGEELFKWMIKYGNVNDYLKNQQYIEWPNEWTYYDTTRHEWLVKPGI